MEKEKPLPLELINPVSLPLSQMSPLPELFTRHSRVHGQAHVSRVIIHVLLLCQAQELEAYALKAWTAAYIHDIGRRHDGISPRHGKYAVNKVRNSAELKAFFTECGVVEEDWEEIFFAVTHHCLREVPRDHPWWTLTALLKDADGLDRVRLRDLNPRFLRFPLSRHFIPFAQALHDASILLEEKEEAYFPALWQLAEGLLDEIIPWKF